MRNKFLNPEIFFLFALFTGVTLTGCEVGTFTLTDRAAQSTSAAPSSSVSFSGLTSIDNVTDTSVRLNWAHASGAISYKVYEISGSTATLLASVNAPTATYTITGLGAASTHTYRVRLLDSSDLADANINNLSVTTSSITATFGGWSGVKAIGPRTPAAQAPDIAAVATTSVTLTWNAIALSSGSVDSYNVYRSATPNTETYTTPIQTGIATATRSYTDTSASGGQIYYYNIAPVVSGQVLVPTSANDREIKVIVPMDNMVLLHRWMANQEICTLMGKTADRDNHYRCAFTGPGGNGTYFDQGTSLFVDRYELGCNYTATAGKCGSANGCIGILSTPNAVVIGDGGDVYYSRRNATCYVNTAPPGGSSTGWVAANSATIAQRKTMGSSSPGLPPFVVIDQAKSRDVCSGQTVVGFSGQKRLLRKKEQLAISAWDASLSDATIDAIENGTNLDTTHYCNSNSASPQGSPTTDISGSNPTIAYDNTAYPAAANRDTLPGCRFGDCASTASSIRSLRTGSTSTNLCVSRYGVQDAAGNVWEWTSDQITCNGASCAGLASGANPIDPANDDFSGVTFDGSQGPTTFNTISTWGRLQIPIGIPIVNAGFSGDGKTSFTSTQLHGDYFYINVASSSRGAFNGGNWAGGTQSGRFVLVLFYAPTYTSIDLGSRCALPAE